MYAKVIISSIAPNIENQISKYLSCVSGLNRLSITGSKEHRQDSQYWVAWVSCFVPLDAHAKWNAARVEQRNEPECVLPDRQLRKQRKRQERGCRCVLQDTCPINGLTKTELGMVYLQPQNRSKYGCTYFRDTWHEEVVAIFFF